MDYDEGDIKRLAEKTFHEQRVKQYIAKKRSEYIKALSLTHSLMGASLIGVDIVNSINCGIMDRRLPKLGRVV